MKIHFEQDVCTPRSSPALDSMSCTSSTMSDFSLAISDGSQHSVQASAAGDSDSMSCTISSSVSDSTSDSSVSNDAAKIAALDQELVACKIEWAARFIKTLNKEYEIDQTVVNGISPSMHYYSPEAFKAIVDMLLQYKFGKILFLLPGRLEVYNYLILQQRVDGNSPDITEVTEELKEQWTAEVNDPVNLAAAREKTEAWKKDNCVTLARIPEENIYTYDTIETEAKNDEKGNVQEGDLDLFKFAEKLIDETYKSKKAKAFRNEIESDAKDYRDRMGEKMGCPEKYQTQKAQWLAISYRKKELAGFLYFALRHKACLFTYPSKEAKSFRALRRDIVPSLLKQGKLEQDYNWWGMEVKDKSEIEKKSQKADGHPSPELSPPSSPSRPQTGSIDINMRRLERKQKQLEVGIEQLNKEKLTIQQQLKQTVDPAEHKKLKDDFEKLSYSYHQLEIHLKSVERLVEENAEKLAQEKLEKLVEEKLERLVQEKFDRFVQQKLARDIESQSNSFERVADNRYSMYYSPVFTSKIPRTSPARQLFAKEPESKTLDLTSG